ncbi:pyrimidine 5'-nucleotidase [Geopsychrobacter electrodiphilus]|uniref:pyrimidine 5'-nucleotidase n=1 Tax=Geopsychrobacter electrodiphilus TaxID=225196 RepID=UPI0003826EB1|nr:pyrimidine 5'-nucleotidase [Geopsychrobacter electrodiphilus]
MKALLFDLDNTLYPADKNLFALIDVRINRYMEEVVGIPKSQVDPLRRQYWQDYGATLQGLIRHYAADAEDYLEYVHRFDIGQRLSPDLELQETLKNLDQPCFVFTNGSRQHAEQVTSALGIRQHFEEIFDIRIADYQPKPSPLPYQQVLKQLCLQGKDCVMIEDSPANLKTAKKFGMTTLLIGPEPAGSFVDAQFSRSAEIGPWLKMRNAQGTTP